MSGSRYVGKKFASRDGMKVRLLRKHANKIDGVDLFAREVGDVFEVSDLDGRLLLAEEWAAPERRDRSRPTMYRRRADDHRPARARETDDLRHAS